MDQILAKVNNRKLILTAVADHSTVPIGVTLSYSYVHSIKLSIQNHLITLQIEEVVIGDDWC